MAGLHDNIPRRRFLFGKILIQTLRPFAFGCRTRGFHSSLNQGRRVYLRRQPVCESWCEDDAVHQLGDWGEGAK